MRVEGLVDLVFAEPQLITPIARFVPLLLPLSQFKESNSVSVQWCVAQYLGLLQAKILGSFITDRVPGVVVAGACVVKEFWLQDFYCRIGPVLKAAKRVSSEV